MEKVTKQFKEEIMDEKMKQALLECCERHTDVLSQGTIDFAYDLIETYIKATPNVIDDQFIGLINSSKPVVESFVKKAVDKIDGVEGNL